MVITKIQGGLGNQMFQWAYGKALSIKHNTDLLLDVGYYSNQGIDTPRKFDLINFPNLTYKQPQLENKNIVQVNDNFYYSDLKYDENYNYFLNGFWQSEKYFIDIEEIIRKELAIDKETEEKLKNNIIGNCVSLHIRRTDYVTSNGYHPVLTMDYYHLALEIIENYDNVLIFSDDVEWCKNNLSFKNMVFIENNTNIEDLWLMSLCNHNIIANSSFSWWGAWLNNNTDKIVIAPKKWFGEYTNLNEKDIIPNKWLKI